MIVKVERIYSSGFLLGFFGLRERLLALHNGQMGALRCICWWQDKQAWREGKKFKAVAYYVDAMLYIQASNGVIVSGCV